MKRERFLRTTDNLQFKNENIWIKFVWSWKLVSGQYISLISIIKCFLSQQQPKPFWNHELKNHKQKLWKAFSAFLTSPICLPISPLPKTIQTPADSLYDCGNLNRSNSSRNTFIQLMYGATKSVNFSCNEVKYRQIDGFAMRSPLGPIFANIFVGYPKKRNCLIKQPRLLYISVLG